MQPRIYLSPPYLTQKESVLVQEALASNWVAPTGPFISEFEANICNYTGAAACAATITGTSAIHLALILAGVQTGDSVVLPTFTFAATVNPVFYCGATPIFIESESATWGMCPDTLRTALLTMKKLPKAIIVVHPYGNAAHIEELGNIAHEFNITLIEDAAAALGTLFKGRQVGTFGAMGVFSFNGNKIITTSQGGALIANDATLIEKAKHISMQAKVSGIGFEHDSVGYNYRMSNVLAAIGIAQLETIDERIAQKRKTHDQYQNTLQNFNITFVDEIPETRYNRWLTNVLFENEEQVLKVSQILLNQRIECRRLWKPLHTQAFCSSFEYFGNEMSGNFYKKGLSLPSGIGLLENEVNDICDLIIK